MSVSDIKVGRTYRYFNPTTTEHHDLMNDKRVKVLEVSADGTHVRVENGDPWWFPVKHLTALRPSNAAIDALIDNWDGFDPWGSGMSMLGACCDVLHAAEADHLIEPGAGYRPGIGQDETVEELADALEDDNTDVQFETALLAAELWTASQDGSEMYDLERLEEIGRATRILHLYLNMVRDAGLDY